MAKRPIAQPRSLSKRSRKVKKLSKEQEKKYQAEFNRSKEKHDRTSKLVQRGALQPESAEETRSQLEAAAAAWQAGWW